MSNVLSFKLKSLVGVMIVASIIVVAFAFAATASAAYMHTVTLKQGMSGAQVTSLQSTLGVTPMSGYFGTITKAAVMAFQSAHGLTADGVVGPMTGAALGGMTSGGSYPAGCTSSSGYSTTTGQSCAGSSSLPAGCTSTSGYSPTTGVKCDSSGAGPSGPVGSGDGDLTDFNETSSADSNIQEGETNEVFAFEFDVEGDVSVDRIDFYMELADSTTASDNPDDYFSGATLLVDGDEVASLDVEDWDQDDYATVANGATDDDEYRLRFTSLDLVFADGDNPEVTLALDVNSSIDSDDLAGDWVVDLEADSVRFVDGKGFSSEEGSALTETFGAESEETAELNVSTSSNDPEATTIEVSDTDTTEEVEVFVFEIEEENGVDATINDLTVTVTTSELDESDVVTDAFLYNGSTLLDSQSVATGGVVNFEDIGLDIAGNDSEELSLKLTFADASGFDAGTTVSATITGSSDIDDAEDANGNDEGDMTRSGTATSESHALRTQGIIVVFDDSSYVKTTSDTSGVNETVEFTLEFDITAFGEDMFVDSSCTADPAPATTWVTSLVVSLDGDANSSSTTCTDFDSTGDEASGSFEVAEGQTEHFTVTVLGVAEAGFGLASTYTARLESIAYTSGVAGGGDTVYQFDLTDYKSSAVSVFDRVNP